MTIAPIKSMPPFLTAYFNFIKRFVPDKSERSSVGIDIGAGDCKLVELMKTGDSFTLLSWAVEPIRTGDVTQTLKKILERVTMPCQSLYTAVFGKGTLIRYIDMPRMSLEELRNSFAIEADKYFPFAQNQVYTDCIILNPENKDKRMLVLAAAVKKEIVDQRTTLLTELGFQPDFIGINPIALSNVLNVLDVRHQPEKGSATALLDMGDSVSNLSIMINNVPWFTRDIFAGGRDITNRIGNVLGVGFEEAERLKNQPGEKLPDILNASETTIMNIVKEMRLSFDYFSTERNAEVKQLLLTGGGAMLQGISDIFAKNLDVQVSQWNPLENLNISSTLSVEEVNKNSLKLGVALGLALYEYD